MREIKGEVNVFLVLLCIYLEKCKHYIRPSWACLPIHSFDQNKEPSQKNNWPCLYENLLVYTSIGLKEQNNKGIHYQCTWYMSIASMAICSRHEAYTMPLLVLPHSTNSLKDITTCPISIIDRKHRRDRGAQTLGIWHE